MRLVIIKAAIALLSLSVQGAPISRLNYDLDYFKCLEHCETLNVSLSEFVAAKVAKLIKENDNYYYLLEQLSPREAQITEIILAND